MGELNHESSGGSPSSVRPSAGGPLFYIGAIGLLIAMAAETLAVIGRHIGMPLLGALEVIQTAILLTASTAMLSATLLKVHATVHLLTDRLPERARRWLLQFAALLSAAFFAALAVGSLWLAMEFWDTHEQSELLHIPFRPLRVITFLCVVAIAAVFLRDALRPSARRPAP
jgi:TRAP-type transport system small permease protein